MLNYVNTIWMKQLLIIFVKNPELGKVKSRLAAKIGKEKALSVYKKLLQRTREVVNGIGADKRVCYSSKIDNNDLWSNTDYQKDVQKGSDLGERMFNAMSEACNQYNKICLIGSDNMEITSDIVLEAFDKLEKYDVVFGPSKDGGYYLVAMRRPLVDLFKDINWSTPSVLKVSLEKAVKNGLSYFLLQELNDIDELDDISGQDMEYLLS